MTEHTAPVVDHSAVAESINESINYAMYAVFAEDRLVEAPGEEAVAHIEQRLAAVDGLTVRGWYDISGFRADAVVLIW